MLIQAKIRPTWQKTGINGLKALPLVASMALMGCFDTTSEDLQNQDNELISLDMALPSSLTGGPVQQDDQTQQNNNIVKHNFSTSMNLTVASLSTQNHQPKQANASRDNSGVPCAYLGADEENPFRNGYEMTKFMVAAMGTWTCIADTMIELADFVAHDGSIHATENRVGSDNYKTDDPTHFSVIDDSESQTSIRLYYGFNQDTPPNNNDAAGFYLAWSTDNGTTTSGRLVIDNTVIHGASHNSEDPIQMRMDFEITQSQRHSDMYLRFSDDNAWADGFRIKVSRDLDANPLEQVFVAQGLIEMRAQFLAAQGITQVPSLKMYTVSDKFGEGAAIAEFADINLPLMLTATNHLGNYLTNKTDQYYFAADGDWDYIYKSFTAATLASGRTTAATGGTWFPFDPSLDMLVDVAEFGLGLDADYFTNGKCESNGDSCLEMINGIFDADEGWENQEPNQGSEPQDWRSSAVLSPIYLDSVYPNGTDWAGAFEMNL